MSKQIERKPIWNMTTGEFNEPGAMLKFLMFRAGISRKELHIKLNTRAPNTSHFILNASLISELISDKKDKHGNPLGRSIPRHYLVQLIECFGMKKKEERYYITEFLRSGLPVELNEYVNAPKVISSEISKNMAMANMETDYKELSDKYSILSTSLNIHIDSRNSFRAESEKWRDKAYEFAAELDVMDLANKATQGYIGKSRVKIMDEEREEAEMALWASQDLSYEGQYEGFVDTRQRGQRKIQQLFSICSKEILNNTSSKSTKNMINYFFNASLQSKDLIDAWYSCSINGLKTKGSIPQKYPPTYSYKKYKDFLRRPSAILSSIYKDWSSQLPTERQHDLTIESNAFEEYCCDLFLNYQKYFPNLSSSFISPFDAAEPKATFDLLKTDYLTQQSQYEGYFGANYRDFDDFIQQNSPPYTHLDLPVCTALSFALFTGIVETETHGPITKYNVKTDHHELDYAPSNFSLAWLYTNREHNQEAPDAGMYLAHLMDNQFEITQAKELSFSVLDEFANLPEKEGLVISLKDLCKSRRHISKLL